MSTVYRRGIGELPENIRISRQISIARILPMQQNRMRVTCCSIEEIPPNFGSEIQAEMCQYVPKHSISYGLYIGEINE